MFLACVHRTVDSSDDARSTDAGRSVPLTLERPTIRAVTTDHAVALRGSLRKEAGKANELIRTLKSDTRQARQVRSALTSLRGIQAMGI